MIDLSRINDRTYLESLENKELACQVLGCILSTGAITGKITPEDIVDFKTQSWAKKTFGLQFALLSNNRNVFGGGRYNFKVNECDLSMTALVNEIKKIKKENK